MAPRKSCHHCWNGYVIFGGTVIVHLEVLVALSLPHTRGTANRNRFSIDTRTAALRRCIASPMSRAGGELLWIECTEGQPTRDAKLVATVRQHVMLDHLAKQEPAGEDRGAQRVYNASVTATPIAKQALTESVRFCQEKRTRGKSTVEPDGAPQKTLRRQKLTAAGKPGHSSSVVLRPREALVREDDRVVHQAAWYHAISPDFGDPPCRPNWRNHCKIAWNKAFWEIARSDGTLLEMFIAFAAAKEAAMKRADSSRAYYHHKGKALSLIGHDINRKYRPKPVPTISTRDKEFPISL